MPGGAVGGDHELRIMGLAEASISPPGGGSRSGVVMTDLSPVRPVRRVRLGAERPEAAIEIGQTAIFGNRASYGGRYHGFRFGQNRAA